MRSYFLSPVLFAIALTVLAANPTLAQGKAKRPSDKEIEAALRTVVQLTLSHNTSQKRAKMAAAAAALVSELSGDEGFDQTVARLENKGIRVGEALGSVLENMKNVQCRSIQAEAKSNLKAIYVAQEV